MHNGGDEELARARSKDICRPEQPQPARAASKLGVVDRMPPFPDEESKASSEPSCDVIVGGVEEPNGEKVDM